MWPKGSDCQPRPPLGRPVVARCDLLSCNDASKSPRASTLPLCQLRDTIGKVLFWLKSLFDKAPRCQTIKVLAFRGDRSRSSGMEFQGKLDDEKNGVGPGPTLQECQLFAGHAGISTDGRKTIYGF